MFETSINKPSPSVGRANRREAFAVTLGAHALIAAVLLANSLVNLSFPRFAPRATARFAPMLPVVPPPPPPPPPKNPATAVESTAPARVTEVITAPTVLPDEIQVLSPVSQEPVATNLAENAAGVEGGIEGGVAGGDINGMVGGTPGGIATAPPKGLVVVPLGTKLPMVATSQVYPRYPEDARLHRKEGTVLVRYIIDRKGRVREVNILKHAAIPEFDTAVVKAIRGWRFRPMVDKGETVEVMHDLTVYFVLEGS